MSRSPLKPWLRSLVQSGSLLIWTLKQREVSSIVLRTRSSQLRSGTRPPLTSVPAATALRALRISRPTLGTSSRGSFSPLWKGQQPEPRPPPCKGPCKLSQAVCGKGCHTAPESLGDKQLVGHRGLRSDNLICCVAVNGGMAPLREAGFSTQPIWPPSTPAFLWGRFSRSQSQAGF